MKEYQGGPAPRGTILNRSSLTAALDAAKDVEQGDGAAQAERLAAERKATIKPNDRIVSNDSDGRRYRATNVVNLELGKGRRLTKLTMVREVPKVRGKAARKADKLARRQQRELEARMEQDRLADIAAQNALDEGLAENL